MKTFYERRTEWERKELQRALKRYRTKSQAAEALGMNRTAFYEVLRRCAVHFERKRGNWMGISG